MTRTNYEQRRRFECLPREELERLQLDRFNRLLGEILPANRFYAGKLAGYSGPLSSRDALQGLPFTTKAELVSDDGPFAANRTYPLERYVRFHRTSGTHGRPLAIVDTSEDWNWWIDLWQYVLDVARVESADRVLMAFSFGPFIGFWTAYEAVAARGAMVIPGGGLSTAARLELLRASGATVVCCTPSYALHLAEAAANERLSLPELSVKALIVAGEPGGSVPAIRQRLEAAWGSRLVDHAGATEVGPWGYADAERDGLRIIESEFLAEFRSLEEDRPAGEGELAELVLTSLGRYGSPVIRYRTGDLVRPSWVGNGANQFVFLPQGVLGRRDDMRIVRGVNVFPSAVDAILRGFPEVSEYRATVRRSGAIDLFEIEVEDRLGQPDRIARELDKQLGLRVEVRLAPHNSLPRFEGKGRRFLDLRGSESD